jgi:hypothetical protein
LIFHYGGVNINPNLIREDENVGEGRWGDWRVGVV